MNMNEIFEDDVMAPEMEASVDTTTKTKRDPLTKYKELSSEQQEVVDGLVNEVVEKLGGADDINLALLLGLLDKLNEQKKSAREIEKVKAKKQKEIEKAKLATLGDDLKPLLSVGDVITYYAATLKVTFEAKIAKITEKGVRVEIALDTKTTLKNGEVTTAKTLAGLNPGMKSVAFGKIKTVNGQASVDFVNNGR